MSVGTTWRASKCASDRGCVTTPASGRRTILGFVFERCWRGRPHRWRLDALSIDDFKGKACGLKSAAGADLSARIVGQGVGVHGRDAQLQSCAGILFAL